MECLSNEALAKKIAKSVNSFRVDQGSAPIEKYKVLVEYLKMYGCTYIAQTSSILVREGILEKRRNIKGMGYVFNAPQSPVHWTLFKGVRDYNFNVGKDIQKEAPKKEKGASEQSNRIIVSVTEKDIKELAYMLKTVHRQCEGVRNLSAVSLIKRCISEEDREILFALYKIREFATGTYKKWIEMACQNGFIDIVRNEEISK